MFAFKCTAYAVADSSDHTIPLVQAFKCIADTVADS